MFPYPAGNTAAIPDVRRKYRKVFGENTGKYLEEIPGDIWMKYRKSRRKYRIALQENE
jgi:hypothetical protein